MTHTSFVFAFALTLGIRMRRHGDEQNRLKAVHRPVGVAPQGEEEENE